MRASDFGLLILRLGVGYLLLVGHGFGKFQMLVSGGAENFPDPIGIGSLLSLVLVTLAETLFTVLIMIGFLTRLSAIPIIITFVVAVFWQHGADPLFPQWIVEGESMTPSQEYGLLYLIWAVAIFFSGAGRFSIDGGRASSQGAEDDFDDDEED